MQLTIQPQLNFVFGLCASNYKTSKVPGSASPQCKLCNCTLHCTAHIIRSVVCINEWTDTPICKILTHPQHICSVASYCLSGTGRQVTQTFTLIFIYLLSIYSDEKYMGIILIPSCICTSRFNFWHFIVYEQLHGQNSIVSQSGSQSSS